VQLFLTKIEKDIESLLFGSFENWPSKKETMGFFSSNKKKKN
jgi:hypothetical protein